MLSEESFCEETFKVDAFNNEGEECQVTNVSIKVGDIEWMARSADDALKLEIGEVVRVTAVTGAHLTVKRG